METIRYYECTEANMAPDRLPFFAQKMAIESEKNFRTMPEVLNMVNTLFVRYQKESGKKNLHLWKSDNWGTREGGSYWAIHEKRDGKTYILFSGRVIFKTLTLE